MPFDDDNESSLSWDHTYLLGWYNHGGQAFLTTWDGREPDVYVVVTGCSAIGMPLWDAYVPERARLREIPPGESGHDYARAIGAFTRSGGALLSPSNVEKNLSGGYGGPGNADFERSPQGPKVAS